MRADAFAAVGGFDERARCGEDADLCFRLARAGWALEERPAAFVEHPTRAHARRAARARWPVTAAAPPGCTAATPASFRSPRPRALAGRLARRPAERRCAGAARGAIARPVGAGLVEARVGPAPSRPGRLLSNRARRGHNARVPEPLVSVVVSTFNRPARLARLLDGSARPDARARAFEVVVVDNGSGPETGRVLAAERWRPSGWRCAACAIAVTLGPAGGRNAGWRLARAPLVAFTDDDCRPTPGWLEALVAAAREHPGAVLQGPTRPDPAERARDGWLSHTVRIERLGPAVRDVQHRLSARGARALGGFDESFGLRPAGEDTDLAWRAIESGAPTVFAPDAVVLHAVERVGGRGHAARSRRAGGGRAGAGRASRARARCSTGGGSGTCGTTCCGARCWRWPGPRWLRRLLLARHLMTLRERARREGAGSAAIPFLLVHDAVECGAWPAGRSATGRSCCDVHRPVIRSD